MYVYISADQGYLNTRIPTLNSLPESKIITEAVAMPDHVDTILVHTHKSILIYVQLSHLLPNFLFSLQILLEELLVKPEKQR